MTKIKTSELVGAPLDWAVGKCEGIDTRNNACVWFIPFQADTDDILAFICCADDKAHAEEQCEDAYPECTMDSVEYLGPYNYSTDWSQGGPIIEREKICPDFLLNGQWLAVSRLTSKQGYGPTPLIAAMRCYVASKLGEEVEIPQELIT